MPPGSGTVAVKVTGDADGLKRALDTADAHLAGFGGKMEAFGSKAMRVGKKMTTHLTLPIVGGLGLAVKAFGDFEQQLNTFAAVSGATADQMARISKLAKDLGADVTLPGTSAKDAADAMTELAKAGLSVNDTMAASKAVLQLSAAAQIGNAEAATLTATALNSFGLKGTDAIKVADLLAATANASSAEITDVGLALSQASAVFSASKVPVEDLSTAIGLLANNGIRGSDAGTSLKSALLALQTPSKQQAAIMREIGFALYDSEGNMKSMRDIIGNLETSFKGMTQEQRDANLGILLGSDAIRTGNVFLKEGVKGWDALKVEVTKGGAAAEVAGAKMKGVKGDVEALKSNVETLAISVGEKLAPFLTSVASKLNKLVDWFGKLSPEVQNMILVTMGLVAILGPLTYVIGTVSTALAFLAANPIVLIIAGIAGLAYGLYLCYQKSETFRDIVNLVFETIVNVIGDAVGFILEYFATWIGAFATVAEAASKIPIIGDKFKGVAETIRGAEQTLNHWADAAHKGIDLVTNDAERLAEKLKGLSMDTGNLLKQAGGIRLATAPTVGALPKRAAGGPVSAGRAYMVGERGPEVFVPGASGGIVPNGAGGGGGPPIVVQVVLDRRVLGQVTAESLRDLQRRSGALGLA